MLRVTDDDVEIVRQMRGEDLGVDPGEDIEIRLAVENLTGAVATTVVATVTTTTPGVTIVQDTSNSEVPTAANAEAAVAGRVAAFAIARPQVDSGAPGGATPHA